MFIAAHPLSPISYVVTIDSLIPVLSRGRVWCEGGPRHWGMNAPNALNHLLSSGSALATCCVVCFILSERRFKRMAIIFALLTKSLSPKYAGPFWPWIFDVELSDVMHSARYTCRPTFGGYPPTVLRATHQFWNEPAIL